MIKVKSAAKDHASTIKAKALAAKLQFKFELLLKTQKVHTAIANCDSGMAFPSFLQF